MKLKRMWPGVCILIMFIIFDVGMAAGSSFFSGLFPSDMIYLYVGIFTALSVLIMGVLTFLFGRLCDHFDTERLSKELGFKIVYVVGVVAAIIAGIYVRADILPKTTISPAGKLTLYENAVVGGTKAVYEYDLLSIVYSGILHVILFFTGNKIYIAYYLQIAFFAVFVICMCIALRLLLGKMASFVFAFLMSLLPVFYMDYFKLIMGTDELFLAMFGVEMLVIAIFLRRASDGRYLSKVNVIWFIIVGMVVGFMAYVDAGTIVAVLPFLLAELFLLDDEFVPGLFRLLFLFLGAVVTFLSMILQEGGFAGFGNSLIKWAYYYFKNINIFSLFVTYTSYKLLYLVLFVVMSGVLVGYFRNRSFERVSPFLLSTLLVFWVAPFFGATRLNSQMVATIFFVMVVSCVASLITLTKFEGSESAIDTEEPVDDAIPTDKNMARVAEVVTPEVVEAKATETEATEAETAKTEAEPEFEPESDYYDDDEPDEVSEYYDDAEDAAAEPEQISEQAPVEAPEPEQVVAEEKKKSSPVYVPEGMVLPMGAEDEMEVDTSRMKMPEFKGTIALDRKEKKAVEAPKTAPEPEERIEIKTEKKPETKKAGKYDFDIAIKPGDDFDI